MSCHGADFDNKSVIFDLDDFTAQSCYHGANYMSLQAVFAKQSPIGLISPTEEYSPCN